MDGERGLFTGGGGGDEEDATFSVGKNDGGGA